MYVYIYRDVYTQDNNVAKEEKPKLVLTKDFFVSTNLMEKTQWPGRFVLDFSPNPQPIWWYILYYNRTLFKMRDADKSTDIKHWFAQRAKADEQAHCRRQTDVRAQC